VIIAIMMAVVIAVAAVNKNSRTLFQTYSNDTKR